MTQTTTTTEAVSAAARAHGFHVESIDDSRFLFVRPVGVPDDAFIGQGHDTLTIHLRDGEIRSARIVGARHSAVGSFEFRPASPEFRIASEDPAEFIDAAIRWLDFAVTADARLDSPVIR